MGGAYAKAFEACCVRRGPKPDQPCRSNVWTLALNMTLRSVCTSQSIRLLMTGVLLCLSLPGLADMDCSAAGNNTEQLVCSNPALLELDRQLKIRCIDEWFRSNNWAICWRDSPFCQRSHISAFWLSV